eukprot:CAMPEP_0195533916 /NCGR_PEP_ID=MMETSP0794_2-20130614/41458_1 /TAXON_ID=515487 /ORGANISM="Stephanopyxis turris, Strain CCMP 815" /LENGTH=50 /DNA_ID=CAMNT_0040666601 /DNA_START=1 /DNA_END=150 /DNA_ORIENTATION=+
MKEFENNDNENDIDEATKALFDPDDALWDLIGTDVSSNDDDTRRKLLESV